MAWIHDAREERERESDSNGKKMVDKEAEQSMPRDIISRILLSFYSEPAFNWDCMCVCGVVPHCYAL